MRYTMATSFLILSILLSGSPTAAETEKTGETGFSQWAIDQGSALDRDWNRIVEAIPGVESSFPASVFDGTRGTGRRTGTARMTGGGATYSWKNNISTGGFIHKGMTTDFLPDVTRERSGATRGTGMLESPADAKLSGKRRLPFNAMNFDRNFSTGHRGYERRHPAMGTRISTSGRRNSPSSTSNLGSTRARRRR